jgi:hypothetical protein
MDNDLTEETKAAVNRVIERALANRDQRVKRCRGLFCRNNPSAFAFFDAGKMYKLFSIQGPDGIMADGIVEVPKDSPEYHEIYALIEALPHLWEEAHWDER